MKTEEIALGILAGIGSATLILCSMLGLARIMKGL